MAQGDWLDDPDFTEPSEGDDRPIMGVTGGDMARPGDSYTLEFKNDGETVDTENGERVQFDAVLAEASFEVRQDGDAIEEGSEIRFMTGSARFLSELQNVMPVSGKTVTVHVVNTGFDAEYDVETSDD